MAERRRKTKRLTAGVDGADHAAPDIIALKTDVSLSWVMRQAIRRFAREHDTRSEPPPSLAAQAGGKEASGC